ncbi:hypothetical protein CFBP7129_10350 [Agrobacterium tumefaciens]|uniref:Uncharacterized protein n=1 Tax=Agrobacterium tumefaciens TaxID=358 RepID=A0A4D7YTQ6_AGRTU|nr:hypothetical protein CFBP7129_10350 [Agrobacterium tumefaciens]
MERASAAYFFSPRGRRSRQRDEGARVEIYGEGAPSSDPSGHLLPPGEKKQAATFCPLNIPKGKRRAQGPASQSLFC